MLCDIYIFRIHLSAVCYFTTNSPVLLAESISHYCKVPSPIQLREFGMFSQFTFFFLVDFLIPVIARTSVEVFCQQCSC